MILLKNPSNRQQVEAFGQQAYPRKSNTFSDHYFYPMTPGICRLRTNIFPGENNQLHPNDIFHTISPIAESFKKKNYMESAN